MYEYMFMFDFDFYSKRDKIIFLNPKIQKNNLLSFFTYPLSYPWRGLGNRWVATVVDLQGCFAR